MATSSTLNSWLDELSVSIIKPQTTSAAKTKKLQDNFRRHVRRHTNSRTNQFEVAEHLDGLEEKFQVLSLDNLADALHVRRNELKDFQNHWIPDILDLFLRLSGDPARSEKLLELYKIPIRVGTPPPLKWKDILADSPIDKKDRLWRVPNFRDTDDSGYEDDFSSPETSPKSIKQDDSTVADEASLLAKYLTHFTHDESLTAHYKFQPLVGLVAEDTFVREALLMIRGLPTQLFQIHQAKCQVRPKVDVGSLSKEVIQGVTDRLNELRKAVEIVRTWLLVDTRCIYIARVQDAAQCMIVSFDKSIDVMQDHLLNPTTSRVASTIDVVVDLEHEARQVLSVAEFLEEAEGDDPVASLDRLYEMTQVKQLCADNDSFSTLSELLWPGMEAYLTPVISWISHGMLEDLKASIFVIQNQKQDNAKLSDLWQNTFSIQLTGKLRSPVFLRTTAETILACGKTSAFLRRLGVKHEDLMTDEVGALNNLVNHLRTQSILPVGAAFGQAWQDTLADLLASRTLLLQDVLTNRCGLQIALDGLETIYLGLDPGIFQDIERKVFDRIDRCHDNWNDRFELTAMLEEALTNHNKQNIFSSLAVHSTYTSSRTMQSRRSSVKILSALSFRFSLSWPLANIIEERAMVVYARISLLLMQIKRARHLMERTGYMSAMHIPLGGDCGPAEQKYAQFLSVRLLTFVSTLLSHLMMSTIEPRTALMRRAMLNAASMDDMIQVHKDYVLHLKYSCMVAPKLKVLHQTLISLLDLCIRFSDLVSQPTQNGHDDGEAHSFTSARSKTKTAQLDSESESDDDQLIEGYSSFIVLDDDSSIFKELMKVDHQFEKQLKVLIAGLKGTATAGQHVQELDLLADRLTWSYDRSAT